MFKQLLCHSEHMNINWHVVFFLNGPLVNEVQRDGVSTYVVETGRLRQPLRFAKAVRRIAELLRDTECQLVLSWSAKPHIYGSLAALLVRIPSAWYQLGSPRGVHLSFIDRFATLLPAQLVLTLSEMGKSAQESLWPKRRTKLVYPGVDLDKARRCQDPTWPCASWPDNRNCRAVAAVEGHARACRGDASCFGTISRCPLPDSRRSPRART